MFHKVESWRHSSYLQIWFIESILNTAGAAKIPVYHKQLISSGSEKLELPFRAPELVAIALQIKPLQAPNASAKKTKQKNIADCA